MTNTSVTLRMHHYFAEMNITRMSGTRVIDNWSGIDNDNAVKRQLKRKCNKILQ